ncbi:hypothetical protein MMC16_000718 [Acarospora aff. strigata]|nr:hypothetical protein [Acarospora aff. strigata]
MNSNSNEPLLRADRRARADATEDHINEHINWLAPDGEDSRLHTTRTRAQRFLTSKAGHYFVLLLVSLDLSCILVDLNINLFVCEQEHRDQRLVKAHHALGTVSLVFSCLFMTELLASIWAFGLPYFKAWFHCLDAAVIVAAFVIAICLGGVLEQVCSLIVVLRLWRVFKIIEEFDAGAKGQIDALSERIAELEIENDDLKRELHASQAKNGGKVGNSSRYQR